MEEHCVLVKIELVTDFITVDGRLAGFALARGDVDDDGSWNVSEFFVARRYRRQGVARAAAQRLFARRPGVWTLSVDHDNRPAAALWRSVIGTVAVGPVAETDRYPPDAAVASTWFRFRVATPEPGQDQGDFGRSCSSPST